MVSPHILTNNPTEPSPCHPPSSALSFTLVPKFSQVPPVNRWLRFSAPACPEVGLVLLRVADYWGGAARKASAPGPTDPPPSPPLPGERWQLANTALYICSKHPFQVLPDCKKANFKEIQAHVQASHPTRRKKKGRGIVRLQPRRWNGNEHEKFCKEAHHIRLWRVSATLPYLDFIFTTHTLPRFFLENFRVQGNKYTCRFQEMITTMMPATCNFKEQVQKEEEENLCLFKRSIRTEFKSNVSSKRGEKHLTFF